MVRWASPSLPFRLGFSGGVSARGCQAQQGATDGQAEQQPGHEPGRTDPDDGLARGDLSRLLQLDPPAVGADDDGGVTDGSVLTGVQRTHGRQRVLGGCGRLEDDRKEAVYRGGTSTLGASNGVRVTLRRGHRGVHTSTKSDEPTGIDA